MHRWVIGWMIGGAVALAACTPTTADDAISVCTPLCACNDAPLPGEQHDCVASCSQQFAAHPLGDACVACVIGHAERCPHLIDDCTDTCTQAVPLAAYVEP